MAQPVRPQVGDPGGCAQPVDDFPHRSGVDAASSRPQEERGSGVGSTDLGAQAQPVLQSPGGGQPVRHGALLTALAQDPQGALGVVEVGDIEADELADPYAGRIERLDDGQVPHGQGVPVRGEVGGDLEQVRGLLSRQHPGQAVVDTRGAQARGDVGGEQPFLEGPGREGSYRGGAAGQGGARMPARGQCGEPIPQISQIEGGQGRADRLGIVLTDAEEAQEVAHVDEIGAHGVRGQIPLQGQVPTVGGEEVGARPWHGGPLGSGIRG